MSMEGVAWSAVYRVSTAQQERRPFSWATVRRIWGFARPQRRVLAVFLVLSVVTAFLAIATPLLAGQVVDAITTNGSSRQRAEAVEILADTRRRLYGLLAEGDPEE